MGRAKRTTGYDSRLREVLLSGPRPMSIRALGKELEERFPDVRGATYSSLRAYASEGGVRHPRIDVLRAVGEILGVRWEKLAFNEGAWTEEEEAFRVTAPREASNAARAENARRLNQLGLESVQEELPEWFTGHLVLEFRHIAAVVFRVAESFRRSDPNASWDDCYRNAGKAVGRCIALPLGDLRVALPEGQSRMTQLYATAAAHSLEILADFAGTATDDQEEDD